jgi:hypothetical protein
MKFTDSVKLLAMMVFAVIGIHGTATAKDDVAKVNLRAKTANFHVYINSRRDGGYPWHGPGDLFVLGGKLVTHLPEAPGAVLCIVTLNGKASCPGQHSDELSKGADSDTGKVQRARTKKPKSPCPSSFDCEFDDIALPSDDVFGLVFIDPAFVLINLVEGVILMRKPLTKKDPIIQAFDERLRTAIAALAPPGPFEVKRRRRPFQIRMLDDCSPSCKFTQSEIAIELK